MLPPTAARTLTITAGRGAARQARPAKLAVAALAGGIVAAAATITAALVLGTTATRFLDLGPLARVFWTMFLLSITLIGEALMVGSTAVTSLRTGLFSRLVLGG